MDHEAVKICEAIKKEMREIIKKADKAVKNPVVREEIKRVNHKHTNC